MSVKIYAAQIGALSGAIVDVGLYLSRGLHCWDP